MISEDAISIISSFLRNTLNFMSSVVFPGTQFTVFGLMLSASIIVTIIAFIRKLMGMNVGSGYRGGNNSKIKVNDERRGDTK